MSTPNLPLRHAMTGPSRRAQPVPRSLWVALIASALLALCVTPASAAPERPAPRPLTTFSKSPDGTALILAVRAKDGAPGYSVRLAMGPFDVTTIRRGRVVLKTATGQAPEPPPPPDPAPPEGEPPPVVGNEDGPETPDPVEEKTAAPLAFRVGEVEHGATSVSDFRWDRSTLHLTIATTSPEHNILYEITPFADRYRVSWTVSGLGAKSLATRYDVESSGHWFGQGEVSANRKEPQPWPLNNGRGVNDLLSPFGNVKTPFWLTSASTGLWLDTISDVTVSLDYIQDGVASFGIELDTSFDSVVFVEGTPRAVFDDYVGIVGKPSKSDAAQLQFAEPVWNTWAQFYGSETSESVIEYAEGLAANGLEGHALQLDGGWEAIRGNFRFDPRRFPDPKAMVTRLNELGFDVGLWTSFFINTNSRNFAFARDRGYLLASREDASQPCVVTYWAGVAGLIDLANPKARAWYEKKLRGLMRRFGIDGFKFDTRFYDRSCAPRGGLRPFDYLDLGGDLADGYDHQGVGIRVPFGAQSRRGFVTRQLDKGTDWTALQTAVRQNLSLAVTGHPFVATDMIGGSLQKPPPIKETLIRWAQAAALMPLMYSSTSPLGVTNAITGEQRTYDPQTIELYRRAIEQHKRLAPYIGLGVKEAVATGEPVMKPLFLDFPERRAYPVGDQWMLGDAVMAAPILSEVPARDIYLPQGAWYDTLAGTVIRGNSLLPQYPADIGTTPAFVRLDTEHTQVAARAFDGEAAKAVLAGAVKPKGDVPLRIECPRTHDGPCRGTLAIGADGLGPRAGAADVLTVAETSYDVPAGQRQIVKLRLTPADLRRLQRLETASAWAVTREQADPASRVAARLSTFGLQAPPVKPRKGER